MLARDGVPPRHIRHRRALDADLVENPQLLFGRPAPAAPHAGQDLVPHQSTSLMTSITTSLTTGIYLC
jgi:hypothetical protein